MAYEYSDLVARAQTWAEQACSEQRLERKQAQAIFEADTRTPDNLFTDNDSRPLIVAFMGGTGVGKSSLINRLAGQNIAKTGIERPTSREVTLYHHQSVSIQHLPEGFPLEKINTSRHQDDSRKNIIWIDMPDFDSVELTNKQLVLEWLPHIDVLIYVVSPERYRDNKAWQLLLAEGVKHAWLFVLNQWDRGQPAQYDDFTHQLSKAGFVDPLVFRTICCEQMADEFSEFVGYLESLATEHTVKELEQRGMEVRIQQLQQVLLSIQAVFAEQNFQQLKDFYQQQWQKTAELLKNAFSWPLQQLAMAYAEKGGSKPDIKLWDDWAQSRFNDMVDEVIFKAVQLQIPVKPLKTALTPVKAMVEKTVATQTELACRQALIKPGNRFQRFFIKLMKFCEFVLPALAMTLVGYQVFIGYYESVLAGNPFLGTNFVVHSLLLILLSWLVPYFLQKKLQPSLKKAAASGLNKGLDMALLQIEMEIKQVIENEQQHNQRLSQQLTEIIKLCQNLSKKSQIDEDNQLDRMLID